MAMRAMTWVMVPVTMTQLTAMRLRSTTISWSTMTRLLTETMAVSQMTPRISTTDSKSKCRTTQSLLIMQGLLFLDCCVTEMCTSFLCSDYRENEELDRYEEVGLDDVDYGRMDQNARMDAEKDIARQERLAHAGRARGAAALHAPDEFSDEDERLAQRGAHMRMMAGDGDELENDYAQVNEYEEHKGELGQWIVKKEVTMYAIRTFQGFLRNFRDEDGVHKYEEVIQRMC